VPLAKTHEVPIVFKLTATEADELNRCIGAGNYDSRSHAIRVALGLLWQKHGQLKQTEIQIERERAAHPPRSSKIKTKPVVRPVVKPMPLFNKKMSASRRRKSSV